MESVLECEKKKITTMFLFYWAIAILILTWNGTIQTVGAQEYGIWKSKWHVGGQIVDDDNDPVIFIDLDNENHKYMMLYGVGTDWYFVGTNNIKEKWVQYDAFTSVGGTPQCVRSDAEGILFLYTTFRTETHLYSGKTFDAKLQYRGKVLDGYNDCGCFFEPEEKKWYLYCEDDSAPGEPCGYALRLFTSKDGFSFTDEGRVISLKHGGWHTGDPDIVKIDDTYYMFCDHCEKHPFYNTHLFTSQDLFHWKDEGIATSHIWAGDPCVRYVPEEGQFIMWNEFWNTTGQGDYGIGYQVSLGPEMGKSYLWDDRYRRMDIYISQ